MKDFSFDIDLDNAFKMILRLLRDQLLYPTNQKGNTTHVFLSAVKRDSSFRDSSFNPFVSINHT